MNHEFVVKANDHSLSGGIPKDTQIQVKPGDLLVITASPDDTWSAGTGNRKSNANGLGNDLGDPFGFYTSGPYKFLYGSLVGTFDDGQTYFGVGTYLAMTILTEGTLKFVYWDINKADNSGSVKAVVQLYNGPQ